MPQAVSEPVWTFNGCRARSGDVAWRTCAVRLGAARRGQVDYRAGLGVGVFVHRSNRAERLVEVIAGLWSQPRDPFVPEHLVVQSDGLAQWVKVEVARRLGVVARVEVQRPRELLEAVLEAATGRSQGPAWRRERLVWSLLELLSLVEEEAEGPGPWLRGADLRRRFQLAGRLAQLFDQYAVYRPELVLGWEAGASPDWQARLWRALVAQNGGDHPARLARAAVEALRAGAVEGLPARVVVFGVSSLPPLYLEVLAALSECVEVHLLVLSPSREFWADARRASPDASPHPLLTAFGQVGADLQDILEELGGVEEAEDLYVEPSRDSALCELQGDLLALRRPHGEHLLRRDDASIQVLSCHSPVREVEAARDAVRSLLEADPTLTPRDVVWLTPDITLHGPLIDATLGVGIDDPQWLPWSVADRPLLSGNASARALLAVLGLRGRRLAAGEVLALLDHAPLRERFGISEAEVGWVERMVDEAAIRWGRDGAHRAARAAWEDDLTSWRAGLERLLLGVALDSGDLFAGRTPVDGVRGEAAERAGRLAGLVDEVLGALADAEVDRPVSGWVVWLGERTERWLGGVSERSGEVRALREALRRLADDAGELALPVPFDLVASALEAAFQDERRPGGFLRGGMTVGELLPMRAVPFRVVVLLGMSDRVYPRADVRLGFDRMAAEPRRGDRSRRQDDRTMFLEAMLSARDALIVTTVARSVRNDHELPPSPVVHELLDALDEGWQVEGGGRARDVVVREVPLQPFSTRYARLDDVAVTWDGPAVRAAERLLRPPERPRRLAVTLPARALSEVRLEALQRLLRDPVEAFLVDRLGLAPGREEAAPEDLEPVLAGQDALATWALGERWLALRLRLGRLDLATERLRAAGWLPAGSLAAERAALAAMVEAVARAAEVEAGGEAPRSRQVDVEVGEVRLVGRIDGLRGARRLDVGMASLRAGEVHKLFPRLPAHLAAQIGGPLTTVVIGRGDGEAGRKALAPTSPEVARAGLAGLLALYREGTLRPLRVSPAAVAKVLAGGGLAEAETAHLATFRDRDDARLRWERVFGSARLVEGVDDGRDVWAYADAVRGFLEAP
jgi:exodeoxyribonuclease V gamma subunit